MLKYIEWIGIGTLYILAGSNGNIFIGNQVLNLCAFFDYGILHELSLIHI